MVDAGRRKGEADRATVKPGRSGSSTEGPDRRYCLTYCAKTVPSARGFRTVFVPSQALDSHVVPDLPITEIAIRPLGLPAEGAVNVTCIVAPPSNVTPGLFRSTMFDLAVN